LLSLLSLIVGGAAVFYGIDNTVPIIESLISGTDDLEVKLEDLPSGGGELETNFALLGRSL